MIETLLMHKAEIIEAVLGIVVVASVIVGGTKTPGWVKLTRFLSGPLLPLAKQRILERNQLKRLRSR